AGHSGGGIYSINFQGSLSLNNVTISGNTAAAFAGGLEAGGAATYVQNTIIAGNTAGTGAPDCGGTLTGHNYNPLGVGDSCSGLTNGVNGNQVGTGGAPLDPGLGPLAANGGPTRTHALLPNSPALDAANPLTPGSGGFACAPTDQRGVHRP